jgi:hypothetical protein
VIVIRIHSLLYPITYEVLETDTILTKLTFGFIDSGLSQNILATSIIYFHVLYINRLVIKHRLATQITLLPGLIYAVLVSILPEYSLLTPFLIANTFVLMSISQIFNTYKRPKAADTLFNIGFLITISSLFVPNYLIILLVGFIALFVLRSVKVSEIFQLLSGAVLVFFAFSCILYLVNIKVMPELLKLSLIPRFTVLENRGSSLYKIIIIFAVSIFAVLNYGSYTIKKSIQTQKKVDILYWFMIFSLIMFFLFNNIDASQALLLCIPLSFMFNTNFINIRSILVQEVIHICILGLLFALNFGLL